MSKPQTSEEEFPRRYDWEDYYSGHGIEIRRQFVELENDAYWVYRAECEEIGVAARAETSEEAMAVLLEHILEDDSEEES